jgi:hypothetical protein
LLFPDPPEPVPPDGAVVVEPDRPVSIRQDGHPVTEEVDFETVELRRNCLVRRQRFAKGTWIRCTRREARDLAQAGAIRPTRQMLQRFQDFGEAEERAVVKKF